MKSQDIRKYAILLVTLTLFLTACTDTSNDTVKNNQSSEMSSYPSDQSSESSNIQSNQIVSSDYKLETSSEDAEPSKKEDLEEAPPSSEEIKVKLDVSGKHYSLAKEELNEKGYNVTLKAVNDDKVERMLVVSNELPDDSNNIVLNVSIGKSAGNAETNGYLDDFVEQVKINSDIKAHVSIDGTKLDYYLPVSKNNYDYMTMDLNKQKSNWGTPFVGMNTKIELFSNSDNIMLYSYSDHKNKTRFQPIHEYKNLDFYKSHPIVNFDTMYEKGQYKIIGMFISATPNGNSNTGDDFAYWSQRTFNNESEFNNYISKIMERSFFTTSVDVKYGDSLLSMQTSDLDPDRINGAHVNLILVSRRIRPNESTNVDVNGAKLNPNQKRP